MAHKKLIINLSAILAFLITVPVFAAKEKQNIYLFDCTRSMERSGIWASAKSALQQSVGRQSSDYEAEFILIPFGNAPYRQVSFNGAEGLSHNWEKTFKDFDGYMNSASYTHISDVLKAGFAASDSNKDTDIFLLTDGDPNSGDTPAKVAAEITRWCASHRNARLFYVLLKGASINPEIKHAVDQCDDAWLVDCTDGLISVPMPIGNEVYASLLELNNSTPLLIDDPSEVQLRTECHDPYFNVEVSGGKSTSGVIPLQFSLRGDMSADSAYAVLREAIDHGKTYQFEFTVIPLDKSRIIANPDVTAHIAIERLPKLSLLSGKPEEIRIEPGAEWHDSFLWSQASEPGYVEIDLNPHFTDVDAGKNPRALFVLESTDTDEGEYDFTTTYNGVPVSKNNPIAVTPEGEHLIRITFNTDAKQGKRYFRLVPVASQDLGMINGVPVNHLEELPMRTSYDECWNTLKTICFWLGVIILVGLLLWFVVLRPLLYPTIAAGSITITGPDSYYRQKRIKGARKVVFTSRRCSQGFFSRLFTGRIIYEIAPYFNPELTIVHASRKRIRFDRPKGWSIFPSSTLSRNSEANLINETSGEKFDITLS